MLRMGLLTATRRVQARDDESLGQVRRSRWGKEGLGERILGDVRKEE